jgi:lytic cellulose monooxygenase (C1-hydroxylating)
MHSYTVPAAALAAIAALPAVQAHGYVSGVVSGGKWYTGASPSWVYESTKPQQAGWFAYNQDNGYVAPAEYGDNNITCHKGATPGTTSIPVTAGDTIELQWTTWPDSHHGPVLNYLARCNNGDCTTVNKENLNFFKINASGLISDSTAPGTWATDELIANNNTWNLKVNNTSFTTPSTPHLSPHTDPLRPLRQLRPASRNHRAPRRRV